MSIAVSFAVKGIDSLDRKIQAYVKKKRKDRQKAILKAAYIIAGDAKALIQRGPKTGRQYGRHRASAPGQPPASDTGNLAGSITVEPVGDDQANVIVRAEYAAALELGTDDGKIKERPFMRPAAHKNKKVVSELLKEASRGN